MHVQALGYMEGSGLVVDFSSAFAALIHELLHTKLPQLTTAASTCHGISSSLKGRREQMRLGKAKFNTMTMDVHSFSSGKLKQWK